MDNEPSLVENVFELTLAPNQLAFGDNNIFPWIKHVVQKDDM